MNPKIERLAKELKEKIIINEIYRFQKWQSNKDLKQEIIDTEIGELETFREKVWGLWNGDLTAQKCYCGKKCFMVDSVSGWNKFCSNKCSANSPETRKAFVKTCLENFGSEFPSQNQEIKDQTKITNNLRYGGDSPCHSKEIRDKGIVTCQERFGCDNAAQNNTVKEKTKATNQIRYGGNAPACSLDVQEQMKQTNIENRGVPYPAQADSTWEVYRKNNVEKHGVESSNQRPEVIALMVETKRKNVVENLLPLWLEELALCKIFPIDWIPDDYIKSNSEYKFIHTECGNSFTGNFTKRSIICPYCSSNRSQIEQKLSYSLQEFFPDLIICDRKKIAPLEIDMIIGNLGIEVNGVYWHQIKRNSTLLDKQIKAYEKDVEIFHFWDSELRNKFDVCRSIVLDKLKHYSTTPSSLYSVEIIPFEEALDFSETNSLASLKEGEFYISVRNEGEIILLASALENKIIQLIPKIYTDYRSALLVLFSEVSDCGMKEIELEIDNRFDNSDFYLDLGFELIQTLPARRYWYKKEIIYSGEDIRDIIRDKNIKDELAKCYSLRDCGHKILSFQLS